MTVKRMRRAEILAAVLLICLLPGALAGRMIYGGEEKPAPGALYPYDAPEGNCLIDLSGGVYADEGYLWIHALVSDAGERRFAATTAEGEDTRCYLLDEKGRRMTDGECLWITLIGDGIMFQSTNGFYGLYGWNGETLVEPAYERLISTGDGSYFGMTDDGWRIQNGEADLIRPGEPAVKISLGGGSVTSVDGFSGGLAPASVYDGESARAGYIDATGQWIIPPAYDYAEAFFGDYAVASLDGRVGLIDREGNTILPFVYDNIWTDDGGRDKVLAAQQGTDVTVFDAATLEQLFQIGDVGYGWIARSAALVVRGMSNDQTRAYSLDGKLICVIRDEDKVLTIINDDRYCVNDYDRYTYEVCDFQGNTLMSGDGLMYDKAGADGVCALSLTAFKTIDYDGGYTGIDWNTMRYGLYDLDGRQLLEPKYDYIVQICEGVYSVQRGQWHGVVDSNGEWILRRSNYMSLMD